MMKRYRIIALVLLIASLACNAIIVPLYIQARSKRQRLSSMLEDAASTVGYLRANADYADGTVRLFRAEHHPALDIRNGPGQVPTGTTDGGLEVWAVHPYLPEHGEWNAFIEGYNIRMRQLAQR